MYIVTIHTMTISRAGRMPRFARVLKKASLFCGCKVCEKAQNSLKKFTCEEEGKQDSTETFMTKAEYLYAFNK